nr:5274_t:CDS:2 [Entrophospora candida]
MILENIEVSDQDSLDILLNEYVCKIPNDKKQLEFKIGSVQNHLIFSIHKIPAQKEFSSYLNFEKVAKLYDIKASTIQELPQFVPGIKRHLYL